MVKKVFQKISNETPHRCKVCCFFVHNVYFSVADSPGGVAYQREVVVPDWVVDYWHPLEKAQYPEYFARREQRKREYVKMWEEKYGKPPQIGSHH